MSDIKQTNTWQECFALNASNPEDRIWNQHVAPLLKELPENVQDIWHYGFTEMFNNALDHSSGKKVIVNVNQTSTDIEISLQDDGAGIFKKIQKALDLYDERHAVLELAKGKFTTDPENHTGQGIFFSSRMFDEFSIVSGKVYFSHKYPKNEDWILEVPEQSQGTLVMMQLAKNSTRIAADVFDSFASADNDYAFSKTIVPVRLAQYGDDKLVSRSQAKRLLARIDKFKIVIFDFSDVESIGQAFADEIFRVFAKAHPKIEIHAINDIEIVQKMIKRARAV